MILDSSGDFNWCEEGCLSYPDKFINVQRPDKIEMYEDEEGFSIKSFSARV